MGSQITREANLFRLADSIGKRKGRERAEEKDTQKDGVEGEEGGEREKKKKKMEEEEKREWEEKREEGRKERVKRNPQLPGWHIEVLKDQLYFKCKSCLWLCVCIQYKVLNA